MPPRKPQEKHLDAKFTVGMTQANKQALLETAHLENKEPSEIMREALAIRLGQVPSEGLMGLNDELLAILRRLSSLLGRPIHDLVREAVEGSIEKWVQEALVAKDRYSKYLKQLNENE